MIQGLYVNRAQNYGIPVQPVQPVRPVPGDRTPAGRTELFSPPSKLPEDSLRSAVFYRPAQQAPAFSAAMAGAEAEGPSGFKSAEELYGSELKSGDSKDAPTGALGTLLAELQQKGEGSSGDSALKYFLIRAEAIGNVASGNTTHDKGATPADTAAMAEKAAGDMGTAQKPDEAEAGHEGCPECDSRRYQDGSSDPGVSYQTPTKLPASTAGVFVAAHEGEHVARETAKAREEGRIVTNKTVTMQMGICSHCNKMYVKGGLTSVTTAKRDGEESPLAVSDASGLGAVGGNVDMEL